MRTPCAHRSALLLAILVSAITTPVIGQETSAQCVLQFDADWSPANHPIDYPAGAHFSNLIGATHDHETVFWQPGGLATPGIQSVAETGSISELMTEVNDVIASGGADSVLVGNSLPNGTGMTQFDFDLSLDFPRVTLVTMIAPSPDWFIGVNGLNLFENGSWRPMTIVDLDPYDAGTDSGVTFNSQDAPTVPPVPISKITENPFPNDIPLGTFSLACDSDLVFLDGFESGDLSQWSSSQL